jgi:ATP-dependent protease ClpP protease subunit
MTTAYISFNTNVNFGTAQQLLGVSFDQIAKGATHLYYLFSTPGGIVDPGIALYNVLKGLPVETTMHNVGAVDSVGNAVFLAGKNRFACPHATFMFHGVGFDMGQAERLEEKDLREKLDSVHVLQRKIGGIIADQTSLKGEDVDGLFLEAQTKDTDFAIAKGIISAVKDVAIPPGAPLIQLVF